MPVFPDCQPRHACREPPQRRSTPVYMSTRAPRSITPRLPVLFAPPPAGVSHLWYRVFPGGVLLQYLTTSQVRVGLGGCTQLTPAHHLFGHAAFLFVSHPLDLSDERRRQPQALVAVGYWHVVLPNESRRHVVWRPVGLVIVVLPKLSVRMCVPSEPVVLPNESVR